MSATQLAACLRGGGEGKGWEETAQQLSQTHLPSKAGRACMQAWQPRS